MNVIQNIICLLHRAYFFYLLPSLHSVFWRNHSKFPTHLYVFIIANSWNLLCCITTDSSSYQYNSRIAFNFVIFIINSKGDNKERKKNSNRKHFELCVYCLKWKKRYGGTFIWSSWIFILFALWSVYAYRYAAFVVVVVVVVPLFNVYFYFLGQIDFAAVVVRHSCRLHIYRRDITRHSEPIKCIGHIFSAHPV